METWLSETETLKNYKQYVLSPLFLMLSRWLLWKGAVVPSKIKRKKSVIHLMQCSAAEFFHLLKDVHSGMDPVKELDLWLFKNTCDIWYFSISCIFSLWILMTYLIWCWRLDPDNNLHLVNENSESTLFAVVLNLKFQLILHQRHLKLLTTQFHSICNEWSYIIAVAT